MINFIPTPYRVVAGLCVVAVAGAVGWYSRGLVADRAIASLKADYAEQLRRAIKAERDALNDVLRTERELRNDIEGAANDARIRADKTAAAAADLAADRDRLRTLLQRYSASRACASGAAAAAASGRPAAASAEVVPGDVRDQLLGEAQDALGVLAPALDSARSGHIACVAAYNAARARLKRMGEQGRALE